MSTVVQEKSSFIESFERFIESKGPTSPDWLNSLRREAIRHFEQVGLPTVRDEDWRFTNVAAIARTDFQTAPEEPPLIAKAALDSLMIPGLEAIRLIFINGRYSQELSTSIPVSDGIIIKSFNQAWKDHEALVQTHLAKYDHQGEGAFSALNLAFVEDGAFIFLPRGQLLEKPIHLLFIATETTEPVAVYPRNLIVLEDHCRATVVEHYTSLSSGVCLSNAVTEAVVGKESHLNHYLIELENQSSYNISTLHSVQHRASTLESHSVLLGGALVRNNVHPVLLEEGCDCLVNGLFMPTGRQHMDNFMKVEHVGCCCSSRQFYRGILDENGRGVFHGRILVHKGANKTDAKQTNRNLLLSKNAQIDTKPQLEIYADDVKCTHGATIGQMDENALFYLRSRCLSEHEARSILLSAFAGENLERMKCEPVRLYVQSLTERWFSNRKNLEESQ